MQLAAIGRYPVKSMLGESPEGAEVRQSGVAGDRAWALVDVGTDKVASAKRPREWGGLLAFRASYAGDVDDAVSITLPDGAVVGSDDGDVDARLSACLDRPVRLVGQVPPGAMYDEEWPDVSGLAPADFIAGTKAATSTDGLDVSALQVGALAPGTFQDVAPVTLLTTASLRAAQALHPDGDWDARRFRPTFLIDVEGDAFLEQEWLGRTLRIGDVALDVMAPTPRCVMVTLGQQDLTGDAQVLRTLAKHNRADAFGLGLFACLGVYASVRVPGAVRCGDRVELA